MSPAAGGPRWPGSLGPSAGMRTYGDSVRLRSLVNEADRRELIAEAREEEAPLAGNARRKR